MRTASGLLIVPILSMTDVELLLVITGAEPVQELLLKPSVYVCEPLPA